MSLDVWNTVLPYPFQLDEEPDCGAPYVGHRTAARTLHCLSAAPGHVDLPGDGRHGAMVEGQLFRWSDEDAAVSLAEAVAAGPQCSDCSSPAVTRGLCAACAGRELAADDRETESEAA